VSCPDRRASTKFPDAICYYQADPMTVTDLRSIQQLVPHQRYRMCGKVIGCNVLNSFIWYRKSIDNLRCLVLPSASACRVHVFYSDPRLFPLLPNRIQTWISVISLLFFFRSFCSCECSFAAVLYLFIHANHQLIVHVQFLH
jgi:hypothetical protein